MKKFKFIILFCATITMIRAQNSNAQIIASINPPNPDMSGIAVSSDDRVFLGFPRHADNHKEFALAELKDGKLIPWPDKEYVYPSAKPVKEWLVSPHGMYMDKNDVLWIIDDGKRSGTEEISQGAAKVVAIDIKTKKIVHSLEIPKGILRSTAHYNDLRVDLLHGKNGMVYIANSGFGKDFSLVIIDVASGKAKEVLRNHKTTSPDQNYMAFLEGKPRRGDNKQLTLPGGGADGISISPDSQTLYWTTISGRNMYSLSTAILSDFSKSETEIENAVTFEGQHPACDGIAEDENGNIYFGAYEQQSLVKRTPDGEFEVVSHDPANYVWPDGLAFKNGYLYVTLGQWNRLASFNNNKDLRKPPYLVVKIKIN
ncbi:MULTISPECIES: L-dopachrome tautomerase-related protein [Chryseobacterium]|uniref:Sugar lactone lactonase YvrE n=1 Tax=Chryseobacterium camelliae TaxID=1265445 RepID=A0ABU0TFP8_9FLAO|nr:MULTISPECIES: L-dopachrome tautomerase-related protein [Chryseobacterium]MDT3406317.1 sugar lactone lactonase YvrE [Pseudacidovorax intermedius]MDQ1095884.1 sugar lactone lactonase YvrE [Chryseobacterium camelliae]MDQ1099821.1 sugar lactone lactonase YvrE [Chryseobacterium sp. SORGH_AS_1048]MDR6087167.1 sugar lactone lactonase YvrE [Chryseobacterium sp. SORGH_AS_0909]MDR6131540.1 sugar lactone lactonase YvrE [Chryseobacterium sp. SORGH_AS_1175]